MQGATRWCSSHGAVKQDGEPGSSWLAGVSRQRGRADEVVGTKQVSLEGTVKLVSRLVACEDRRLVTGYIVVYTGHRYPGEVIAHCVWLYFRFPLSFREVEELMLQTRHCCQLRNHPGLVREVRADLRQPASPAPGPARR